MNGKISIVIADAQPIYRAGLKAMLASHDDLDIVGEASNTQELEKALESRLPDVLILDYNPEFFKPELLSKNVAGTQSRVVIISSAEKQWQIFQSLQFNVFGYLTKECGLPEVHRAIRAAVKGEKFFCRQIIDRLSAFTTNSVEGQFSQPNLSEREVEIVKLIAYGKKNKEIGERLNLSHHTIHSHRKNIMKKLNVNSASEITAYAIKMGIIEE